MARAEGAITGAVQGGRASEQLVRATPPPQTLGGVTKPSGRQRKERAGDVARTEHQRGEQGRALRQERPAAHAGHRGLCTGPTAGGGGSLRQDGPARSPLQSVPLTPREPSSLPQHRRERCEAVS